jgi:hypothetical protein
MNLRGYGLVWAVWVGLWPALAQAEFVEPSFAEERSPALPAQAKPLQWAQCLPLKDASGEPDLGFSRASFQCPKAKLLMGQGIKVDGVKRQPKRLQLLIEGSADIHMNFSEQWLAPFLDTVHSTDLNGDGKPDFVLELSFHGNGLAAVHTQALFIVSDPKGYRYSHFKDITSPALSQFGSAERSAVLASAATIFNVGRFASALGGPQSGKVKTSDGKPHVFFVFDLLGFMPAESLPILIKQASYPRWVLFQQRADASETKLISAQEKSKLWASPLIGLRSGYLSR